MSDVEFAIFIMCVAVVGVFSYVIRKNNENDRID